jgi:methionyl aminopeptidase
MGTVTKTVSRLSKSVSSWLKPEGVTKGFLNVNPCLKTSRFFSSWNRQIEIVQAPTCLENINRNYTSKANHAGSGLKFSLVRPGKLSGPRDVPETIRTPEYYKTGKVRPVTLTEPEIKSGEQIEKLRKACQLARRVLNEVVGYAKAGVTTDELDSFCHDLIIASGAYPSPLYYKGFPKSICTSVNNCACHGIPDDRKLEDGDVVNIDVTVYLDGYHGDCSETVMIGSVDSQAKKLVDVAKRCMYEGISVCGPNVPFYLIGMAIQNKAESHDMSVVPVFAGHGIGEYFHGPPDIYHFDYECPGSMKPGMTFTVEPIISEGGGDVKILQDGWTAVTKDNARTAQFEHTILITPTGFEILT